MYVSSKDRDSQELGNTWMYVSSKDRDSQELGNTWMYVSSKDRDSLELGNTWMYVSSKDRDSQELGNTRIYVCIPFLLLRQNQPGNAAKSMKAPATSATPGGLFKTLSASYRPGNKAREEIEHFLPRAVSVFKAL
ncbi:hypothetical protein [Thalassomonas haliotis]|uniref:Uncharacterized protein n=1 Tax=Thalassomonas haliotis TaxID=485448 RepID=A0ABY7VDB6_9GAMM|nr:hypothetical protein [Thalassomonas haliotis]WDE11109.1 hypothetical protein H3N35_23195 [Thalassomonas haliotis]